MLEKTKVEEKVEANRKELESMTVKALIKEHATPLNIVGRHDMKKADLIQAILMAYANSNPEAIINNKINSKKDDTEKIRQVNKMRYIENANIGTIVAFKLPGMKVKSAKIVRKSTKNRKFKVETSYGMEFVITYDDILWVKTNRRWPKGVYLLLKGKTKE